jgi:hypothetical protein
MLLQHHQNLSKLSDEIKFVGKFTGVVTLIDKITNKSM